MYVCMYSSVCRVEEVEVEFLQPRGERGEREKK
jgi:hypothetical protein